MERTDSVETIIDRWFAQPFGLVGAEPDDDTGGGDGGGDTGAGGNADQGGQGGQDGDGGDNPGDGLTDAGRQAIDRERQAAQRVRDKLKPWNALARETGLTLDQIRERLIGGGTGGGNSGGSGDGEQVTKADIEAARREGAIEANARANQRIIRAEVKALAADTFADPRDAAIFLNLDEFEVDEDGEVDSDAIKKALKDVLKDRPYLAKRKGTTQTSGGSPDGGARETPPKPKGMSDLIRNARR